jgi:choline dehydrogenase-like flavoprotein
LPRAISFAKILIDDRYMWNYETMAEPGLKGRSFPLPHGKVIGGSSAVNGLVFTRGLPGSTSASSRPSRERR